jgi:putative salt-induced outer membrane protein YdiY
MLMSKGWHSQAAAILVVALLHSFGRAAERPDLWLLPPVDDVSIEDQVSAAEDDPLAADLEPLSLELEEPAWYDWLLPSAWQMPPGWNSSFEVGVDGSEGNAKTLTFRSGANIKRKIDWSDLKIAFSYVKATAERVETKHNAQLDVNHDWLLGESPWSIYGKTIVVYDEFRPFGLELTLSSGLGYRFIDNDSTTLKGRVGSGATRQFRGLDNDWVPEGMLGVDFEHQLSARQKVRLTVEYYPEWGAFDQFRIRSDAGWEMLLSEATNMSLKLGVIDRYDTRAGDGKPNALDYSLLLLWKL